MTVTPERRHRPTLKQIAAEAGVSIPTVSKVVKGRPDVSPELRASIQSLLKIHGYEPRASSPVAAAAKAVELHFDSMESSNNLQIMRGVLDAAESVGIDVVVKITPKNFAGKSWVENVANAQHSGLILVTSRMDDEQQDAFIEAGLPVVVVDPINTPRKPIASVGVNNFMGGYSATQHLLELGHRDIALITGVPSECAQARIAGYHFALHEAGIALRSDFALPGEFRYQEGRTSALTLLSLRERPTAIFASNDLEALGAIDAARSLGLRVPEDVSVVGFDDSLQAVTASPRLTTVRQPFREIGATAFNALLQITGGEKLSTHRLELATQLVVRESTAPFAGRGHQGDTGSSTKS